MANLTLTGEHNYSDDALNGITHILVKTGSQTTFDSSQFDDEQISGNVMFKWKPQDVSVATYIRINGSIDASDWQFGYVDPYIWFYGTEGADTLVGTTRGDRIALMTSAHAAIGDIVHGGDGDDVLFGPNRGRVSHCLVSGGEGNDKILGHFINSNLRGGVGDDTISISGSGNLVRGGMGNDYMFCSGTGPGAESTVAFGGEGDDEFSGLSTIISELRGGFGDDHFQLWVNAGGRMFGGPGNDRFELTQYRPGDAIDVSVSGGTGDDEISVRADDCHFRILGGEGNDQISVGGRGTAKGYVEGGDGSDRIVVGSTIALVCRIDGGAGSDWISVGGETISGFIDGGVGLDSLNISLASHHESITADFTDPDTIHQFGNLEIVGFEAVEITCGSGDDHIIGSMAGDKLLGGAGDDTLDGSASGDWLDGGEGHNVLIGGSGKDVFVASGASIVTDFAQGIDQLSFGFSVDDVNNPSSVFIGTSSFSGAGEFNVEIRYEHLSDHTIVICDIDGDGTGDMTIELAGLVNLTLADFIL